MPVLISFVGLSLPTHPFLDGVMLMLYSVPHSSMLRSQPLSSVPVQLCRCPVLSTADTVYETPATLSFQVTDTSPVLQFTVGRKDDRGQGAEQNESGNNKKKRERRSSGGDKRDKVFMLRQHFDLKASPAASPTCQHLLCGALGAVAAHVLSHHRDAVGQIALYVLHYAVMLLRPAAADVTFAAHHGGVEPVKVTRRLPGDVEDAGQTVEVVLYVLRHTWSWRETETD